MGVNNKARRAAKRRKERRGSHGFAGRPIDDWYDEPRAPQPEPDAADLKRLLTNLIAAAVRGHWTPADLAAITARRLTARHLPLVAALVALETARHPAPQVARAWRQELDDMGPAAWPDLNDGAGRQLAIELAMMLERLPVIAEVLPPPGSTATSRGDGDAPSGVPSAVLSKIRALLAKAESTEFPDEAEALSAKAQQLIARYALDRYTEQLDAPTSPEQAPAVRRLWLDPPYVDAKAMLVNAVAGANHCRTVFSTSLGFVTLVGQVGDVDAVELLVTSLQVQADRAMLRHGRTDDHRGTSRTRSFRRSFLLSYAMRIGERLQQATDETLAASSRSSELVPVLARSDEQVQRVTDELFPDVVARRTTISNAHGWTAGRAAADLAQLDVRDQVTDHAPR